ncbi:uncharacterized protein LOC111014768 isoform X2 [Momordica charantia]|nr:uncharacterized protein LOC111014768 isoform X2 [Momordica charantia]
MKKLIDKEMSTRTNPRHNGPSIVARLMGMDMLPLDAKDEVELSDKRHNSKGVKTLNKESTGRGLPSHVSSKSNYSKQMDLHSSYHDNDQDADQWSSSQKMGKPCRREHPQEEELQKFKKEFEAWQASRFRHCSRVIEVSSINRRSMAQEEMALNGNTGKISSQKLPAESEGPVEMKSRRSVGLDDGTKRETFRAEQTQRGSFSLRSKSMDADFEHPCLISCDRKTDKLLGPTKIVILKPGPDKMCLHEEHWTNSSGTLGERVSIEDFLEEVKERLRCELQGKTFKKGTAARGSGIETPYSEKPSHSRQIARNIATQVRDSITRDTGISLLRSESTRSCKSEIQFNALDSPEFLNKDTRRFLSERMRNNVQSKDSDLDSGSSRSSVYDQERVTKQVETTLTSEKHTNYWEILRDSEEMQTRSFRHEADVNEVLPKELSPRNLTRSVSAPVAGTSFGKLLLEDRHILTGVHIQRKHEASDHVANIKKQKKERFNFKEKVSNFRYNFTLRGKLFGRKTQSISGLHTTDLYSTRDILSGPTVVMNSGERHERENFTEVPPSPASVCSSVQEEFWKFSDHHSPISTSDVTPRDENCVSQVFRDISSNLKELRRQLNQLESDDFEDKVEQQPVESEITKLEDPAEAYVRDLLIVSGMYDGSTGNNFSRNNTAAKPISNAIFEEVEEAYRKSERKNETIEKEQNEYSVDHKLLFDLLNEALPLALAPCLTMSRFRTKVINSSTPPPPLFGKKLLDSVWDIIHKFTHPPTDRSYYLLDGVMARDLNSTPWSSLMDDEVNTTGREVEGLIINDLVEEIVKDFRK